MNKTRARDSIGRQILRSERGWRWADGAKPGPSDLDVLRSKLAEHGKLPVGRLLGLTRDQVLQAAAGLLALEGEDPLAGLARLDAYAALHREIQAAERARRDAVRDEKRDAKESAGP